MRTSDDQLLSQYVEQRSDAAFRQLVERYSSMVFSICRRKLGDQQLAEDAVQRVFLALASNARRLKPGPLDGYLAKTAIFVSREIARRRAVRLRHEQLLREAPRSMRESPDSDDRLTAIQSALAQLRETYREAVTLRYVEGLSVDGVAEVLGIAPEAAKKRVVRALAHLRQRMLDQGFSISLSFAAATLLKLRPLPPPGLVGRILSAIVANTSPAVGTRPTFPRPRAAWLSAAAAGVAVVCVLAVAMLPKHPKLTPAAVPKSGTPLVSAAVPLTLNQRLDRKIPGLELQSVGLESALWSLSRTSGIPIEAQWDTLEPAGVRRDLPIQVNMQDMTARQQLQAILNKAAPGQLDYIIMGDKVVVGLRHQLAGPQARLEPGL